MGYLIIWILNKISPFKFILRQQSLNMNGFEYSNGILGYSVYLLEKKMTNWVAISLWSKFCNKSENKMWWEHEVNDK